jgi:metal-responsive CopG/Arc/MetJ family transcriptional regulator
MASITVNIPDDLLSELNRAAADSGGLGKYIEKALGLKRLVDEETKKHNLIAIADKNGKVLKTVRTSSSE